ncbi:MAG: type II secretion system protein M [Rikenellaceae bacterium]|nr:type II secretion system protein M [Rikenellaceae bacterium]
MRSELEKNIISHRDYFDTEIPDKGHIERFSTKLTAATGTVTDNRNLLNRGNVLRIGGLAASVVLMLMLINPLSEMARYEDSQLAEAADYFAWELRNKAEEVKALAVNIDPAYRHEVISDIEALSEFTLEHIPHGMKSEEEAIGLLYEHYQARSSSLEMIENSITNILGTAE